MHIHIYRTTDSYHEAEIYFLKALKTLERWRLEDGSVKNEIELPLDPLQENKILEVNIIIIHK
jgi:hypothetical protein